MGGNGAIVAQSLPKGILDHRTSWAIQRFGDKRDIEVSGKGSVTLNWEQFRR